MTEVDQRLERLDVDVVRAWSATAVAAIRARREEIDSCNVFPIADRDTGANLLHTLIAADHAVAASPSPGPAGLLADMAAGAARSAHGNSGTIIAQMLQSMASSLSAEAAEAAEADSAGPELSASRSEPADVGGQQLARSLAAASRGVWAAVAQPVEGTMLSVVKQAAVAANQLESDDASAIAAAALTGATAALAATTGQLAILAQAGVVDAGGIGVVILLESLCVALSCRAVHPTQAGRVSSFGEPSGGDRFEVQYLLATDDRDVRTGMSRLREALRVVGDSITIAAAGGADFAVHLHTSAPGRAIEAGIELGRVHNIRLHTLPAEVQPAGPEPASATAVLAIAAGAGTAALFRAERGLVLQSSAPTTAEILQLVLDCGAARVVVLPNSLAAGQLAVAAAVQARSRGVGISVVPTRSPVQGLAALAVHDPLRRFDDDVIAMAEAAAGTRVAEVTIAAQESITYAGRCEAGDVLGLIDGEVVEIGSNVGRVGSALARRLIAAGGELVTVLVGEGAAAQLAAAALEHYIHTRHPFIELAVFHGGQRDCPLLIGVE